MALDENQMSMSLGICANLGVYWREKQQEHGLPKVVHYLMHQASQVSWKEEVG